MCVVLPVIGGLWLSDLISEARVVGRQQGRLQHVARQAGS